MSCSAHMTAVTGVCMVLFWPRGLDAYAIVFMLSLKRVLNKDAMQNYLPRAKALGNIIIRIYDSCIFKHALLFQKSAFRAKTKKILDGISAYFNPSELIAIMGPSGIIQ